MVHMIINGRFSYRPRGPKTEKHLEENRFRLFRSERGGGGEEEGRDDLLKRRMITVSRVEVPKTRT